MSQIDIVSKAHDLENLENSIDAVSQFESGQVLFFPQLSFSLLEEEKIILSPNVVAQNRKNVSYNPNNKQLGGCQAETTVYQLIENAMERFHQFSRQLIEKALPHYKNAIKTGRTSYRPIEIKGRSAKSFRKDDTRLHVDAFPSTPLNDKRIIRVFSNINPHQQTRNWRLGENIERVVNKFKGELKQPLFGMRKVKQWLNITKSYQSLYDYYMLQLHDRMKEDTDYQRSVEQHAMQFPSGSTWIVFTDQVSHAVDSGQYVLEQTFYLPINNMLDQEKSPQRVLMKSLRPDCSIQKDSAKK